MKKLSRDEMKKLMGGNEPVAQSTKCCIGTTCTDCSYHSHCGDEATETSVGCPSN